MYPDPPKPSLEGCCKHGFASEVSGILADLKAVLRRIDMAGLTLAGAHVSSAIDVVDSERAAIEALVAAGKANYRCRKSAQA